ncbi:MAG: Smr/MutS family protein [Coprobacillus sp.]|nr:Smr/MutS family protein [Coprobacillus sp.]
MQDLISTFQVRDIFESVSFEATTEVGKERISSLSMLSKEELIKEKEKLQEMINLNEKHSLFPLSMSKSAIKIIDIAHKSGLLTPQDLMNIYDDIVLSNEIITFYKKVEKVDYPYLTSLIDSFSDLSSLMKEIKKTISNALTILDTASVDLAQIRKKIKSKETELNDTITKISYKYSSLLSDENMTMRDGHYVLPIKTMYKNKISGIVYDISQTGNTTFIEPLEIVQLNNDITALKIEEASEERKILLRLTNMCLLQEEEIIHNNSVIGEIDFLQAKAKYGKKSGSILLSLEKEKVISLKRARHPLIDPTKVVANSFLLDKDNQIIIISGPNAGGKTVSLKTIGLLIYMNQCGLMIPVEEGKLSYFNHIYIDIGDQQSLSDNLSTFSAHMSNISEILNHVTSHDLVLIDELGTGTDPKEGEALAISIVSYLHSKGVFCLISSHFSGLKEYAYQQEGISNGMMLFDERELSPTYIFVQGVPGKSYAFEVASRFGIKQDIVQAAKERSGESESAQMLDELTNQLVVNMNLSKQLNEKQQDLEKKEKELNNEKKTLERRKSLLLEEVKEEKEQLLKGTEEELNEIMKDLNKREVKLNDVIQAKGRVNALRENEDDEEFDDDIHVGDYVSIPSLSLKGRVKAIKGETLTILTSEGMSVKAPLKNTKKEEEGEQRVVSSINIDKKITGSMPSEINLLGYRTDEAIAALDKYLDEAILHKLKSVRIIHGYGTGALRKAVWDYLKTKKGLSYRYGNDYEGSMGATVVTFND